MNNYRALVDRYSIVVSELRFAIEQALRDAGAEIPYPQKEVWIKPG